MDNPTINGNVNFKPIAYNPKSLKERYCFTDHCEYNGIAKANICVGSVGKQYFIS